MTDAPSAPSPAAAPAREAIFGPIPADARLLPGWVAPFVAVGLFLFTGLIAALPAIAPMMSLAVESAGRGETGVVTESEAMGWIFIISIAVQFPLVAAAAILMALGFERRTLGSMGFSGSAGLFRYLRGLAAGVGFAVVLIGLTALTATLLGADIPAEEAEADWSRLAEPVVALALGAIVVMFLVQSAAEEIMTRGWLMSTLAARWSVAPAVVVSSLVFGVLHIHFFMAGFLFGIVGIAAVSAIGFLAAFWALAERSIYGVCGLHGGFNVTAIGLSLAAVIVTSEDGVVTAFSEAIQANTGVDADNASSVEVMVQLGLFGAAAFVSAFIWARLRHRRLAA